MDNGIMTNEEAYLKADRIAQETQDNELKQVLLILKRGMTFDLIHALAIRLLVDDYGISEQAWQVLQPYTRLWDKVYAVNGRFYLDTKHVHWWESLTPYQRTILVGFDIREDGVIQTPGKYEAEQFYTPILWEHREGEFVELEHCMGVKHELSAFEKHVWNGGSSSIILYEDDQGFINEY